MVKNEMQIFENEGFGKVRVIEIDGQPWFAGKDVAIALGYSNASKAVSIHVDADDKKMEMIAHAQNGNVVTQTALINESGLYSLILSSKLPTAKAFKRWVTSEILPSIRKNGAYITEETLLKMLHNTDFTSELINSLLLEREKSSELVEIVVELKESVGELEDAVDELENEVFVLEEEVEEFQPKANYCDVILNATNAVAISLIAKDYGYSAMKFNKLLHDCGIQYRVCGTWVLYQEFTNRGYTDSKTYMVKGKIATIHTYWTQAGRYFIYKYLKGYSILPCMEMENLLA